MSEFFLRTLIPGWAKQTLESTKIKFILIFGFCFLFEKNKTLNVVSIYSKCKRIISFVLFFFQFIFLKDEIVAAKSLEHWFSDRKIYFKEDNFSVLSILFADMIHYLRLLKRVRLSVTPGHSLDCSIWFLPDTHYSETIGFGLSTLYCNTCITTSIPFFAV